MERDEIYRPDKKIRDVYDSDFWETYHFEEQGLSPFARIGSLQDRPNEIGHNYNRWPKPSINLHRFTFVGPLSGSELDNSGRNYALSAMPAFGSRIDSGLMAGKIPVLITAFIAYLSRLGNKLKQLPLNRRQSQAVNWHRNDFAWVTSVIPTLLTLSALGLIAYAIVAESPTVKPRGGNNGSYPYSKTPTIIDNRNPLPLKSQLNSSSSTQTPATTTAPGSSTTPVGGGTSFLSPSAFYSSGYSPAPTTGYGGGGYATPSAGSTAPSSSDSSTSSAPVSTTTTSPSSTSVPGVTSPCTTTVPGVSLTNPFSGKQAVGSSPTSLTLN